jgi:hypothetical protein
MRIYCTEFINELMYCPVVLPSHWMIPNKISLNGIITPA